MLVFARIFTASASLSPSSADDTVRKKNCAFGATRRDAGMPTYRRFAPGCPRLKRKSRSRPCLKFTGMASTCFSLTGFYDDEPHDRRPHWISRRVGKSILRRSKSGRFSNGFSMSDLAECRRRGVTTNSPVLPLHWKCPPKPSGCVPPSSDDLQS